MLHPRARLASVVVGATLAALAASAYLRTTSHKRLPAAGSAAYEETARHFYHGLGALQVGLLDDAAREFEQAVTVAPGEPAAWADLGLAHLRLGAFEKAAPAIERAVALAPHDADLAMLQGQLEAARGKADAAMALFRRAADLDPHGVKPRYALAQALESAGRATGDGEAQALYTEILAVQPGNLAVLLERARLAAKSGDARLLQDTVAGLTARSATWNPAASEQYRALQQTASAASMPDAARAIAVLRNALLREPTFRDDLAAVRTPAELLGEPFDRFLRMANNPGVPSSADMALSYTRAPDRDARAGSAIELAVDVNRDFALDSVSAGPDGLRLSLQQRDGSFTDATAALAPVADTAAPYAGVWAADIEMDGDLDLIAGPLSGPPLVLRNNGDGTWQRLPLFASVSGLRGFAWGDLDGDGDPDAAMVDASGALHLFENRQGGVFREMAGPGGFEHVLALTVADIDADGAFDLVALLADGIVRRATFQRGAWIQQDIAQWSGPLGPGPYRIFAADMDNNGALDLVASGAGRARVWLAGEHRTFQPLASLPDVDVFAVRDLDGDGVLDMAAIAGQERVRLVGRSTKGYHWQTIRPRAQPTAGDQRINTYGVGGEVEIRSGLLTERQLITSAPVHFGLGTRASVDITRIMWPNGVLQVDFDSRADQSITAEQRLKGSCPWVFADDGTGMRFVTDFLWRSPLGLRINAQDTAGVTQTEDWVRIRGDQLKARNGTYDIRISAELWETHFIDHVSLMSVDHPGDTEVFVDERFARDAPALAVHTVKTPRAIRQAWDDRQRDVTELVARQDGRYVDTFDLGPYQGVASDHALEFDIGREIPTGRGLWLIANGWIYPTDSSINVAIGQGNGPRPHGLALDAKDAAGRWVTVAPDLGFPAGKNKTILIDLGLVARAGVAGATRLRLRTNLEIYWDSLMVAEAAPDARIITARVQPRSAELRYRGFSQTRLSRRGAPETPIYESVANVTERWRNLVGYYTRFGDVRELLADVDDRYVIMNAGDELRFLFPATAAPAEGWKRDFVLIGDGWVKDGDYNTSFSKTVEPLPAHGRPDYDTPPAAIESDPVYRRHPADWQTFHTRFVSPDRFLRGLR